MIVMKLLNTLLWLHIPSVIRAKGIHKGEFEVYQSDFLAGGPLKLSDAIYDQLTVTPRNYTSIILLTALEARFGCQLCKEFQPEWDLLGKSWVRGDKRGDSRTIFGTLDFTDGKNTFQKVGDRSRPAIWPKLI